MKKCKWHLCETTIPDGAKKYCSVQCKNKNSTTNFRIEQKKKAIEYKGGKCVICGYSNYAGAMHFHHVNPKEKDFSLSKTGQTYVWEAVIKELDKCVLMCANCHAEVHGGLHKEYIEV